MSLIIVTSSNGNLDNPALFVKDIQYFNCKVKKKLFFFEKKVVIEHLLNKTFTTFVLVVSILRLNTKLNSLYIKEYLS